MRANLISEFAISCVGFETYLCLTVCSGSSLDASHALQKRAAEVLSNLKNLSKTSQTAVDRVVSGVNELSDLYLEVVKVTEFS